MNIKYANEIEDEYRAMREQINDGERLPYHEYVVLRTLLYIEQKASPEEIELFMQKCIDTLNLKKDKTML